MKYYDPEWKLKSILKKTKKEGDCLIWTGSRIYSRIIKSFVQYPRLQYKTKIWRGHRLVMFLVHGSIPDGMWVLHKCDNGLCVNPEHLYFGDRYQNAKDAKERNRFSNSRKTHCPHGHPYSGENLSINKKGDRHCRSCDWYRKRGLPKSPQIRIPTARKTNEKGKFVKGDY